MKKQFALKFTLLSVLLSMTLTAQPEGEKIFKQTCAACHTINKGKLVGPDLANVHLRRTDEWITKFVQSSQTMIKSGDSLAVANFEEFNKLIMPDQPLSDDQVKLVINYIANESPVEASAVIAENEILKEISEADVLRGRGLFEGTIEFESGGPSCISCHTVQSSKVFPGGTLAKDLTGIFSRMNDVAINSVISNPPFPAMMQAYSDNKLTEQESKELIAFLYYADKNIMYQSALDFESTLIFITLFGIVILGGIYSVMWFRTKKRSVNFHIYQRDT